MCMGFPRQGHWSGLPFPPLGDLLDPRIELSSPALQVVSLPLSHLGTRSLALTKKAVAGMALRQGECPCATKCGGWLWCPLGQW